MRVDIVIPARYASSRLPGKMLLKSTGKYLIQHVYERALQAKCARHVLIATDDSRIEAAARSFGAKCIMTARDHPSGTDRIAEVARNLDSDVVVNLQGDEPEIDPNYLDLLPDLLNRNNAAVATPAVPIRDAETWRNPNCVKIVCDDAGRALYFSRSPIPYVRDGEPSFSGPSRFLQHVGLYAYRRDILLELATQPPCALEQAEKLEQLRVLAMGKIIQVGIVAHAGRGVDTMEDYEAFRKRQKKTALREAA